MEREDEIGPMELVAEREDHDEASKHDQVFEVNNPVLVICI